MKTKPKAYVWCIVGTLHLIVAIVAVVAVFLNSLATTTAKADIVFHITKNKNTLYSTNCGKFTSRINMEIEKWSYNSSAELNHTGVCSGLTCSDLHLDNETCTAHNKYSYARAYDKYCTGKNTSSKTTGCAELYDMAKYSSSYPYVAFASSFLLIVSGVGFIVLYLRRNELEKDYEERKSIVGLGFNLVCCALYAVSWVFIEMASDKHLRYSLEKTLNKLYGSEKGISLVWQWDRFILGPSIYPLALACCCCGFIFIALTSFYVFNHFGDCEPKFCCELATNDGFEHINDSPPSGQEYSKVPSSDTQLQI